MRAIVILMSIVLFGLQGVSILKFFFTLESSYLHVCSICIICLSQASTMGLYQSKEAVLVLE